MQIAVSAAIKRLKGIGQRPPMNVRCNALASGSVPQLQLEETSGFGCGRLDDQARSALERSHDHRVEGGVNGAVDPRPGPPDLCPEHPPDRKNVVMGNGVEERV